MSFRMEIFYAKHKKRCEESLKVVQRKFTVYLKGIPQSPLRGSFGMTYESPI